MQKNANITNWDEVPVVFDVPYAARLLGFKVDTMRAKCKEGKIPAHKVFDEWRINKEELIAFLNNA